MVGILPHRLDLPTILAMATVPLLLPMRETVRVPETVTEIPVTPAIPVKPVWEARLPCTAATEMWVVAVVELLRILHHHLHRRHTITEGGWAHHHLLLLTRTAFRQVLIRTIHLLLLPVHTMRILGDLLLIRTVHLRLQPRPV